MSKGSPSCPSCRRTATWNNKYKQCSGCGYGVTTPAVAPADTFVPMKDTTKPAEADEEHSEVAGAPATDDGNCPGCGRPLPKSDAVRSKTYRDKKRAERAEGVT